MALGLQMGLAGGAGGAPTYFGLWFDGTDDYVGKDTGLTGGGEFGATTISSSFFLNALPGVAAVVHSLGGAAYRALILASGELALNSSVGTGVTISTGVLYNMEIDFDASGNGKVVRLNGSSVWTGTATFFSNTNGRFRVGTRDGGTAGLFFNGWIASVSITGSYALSWLGTGTADADWLDQTGNARNGTVSGSPARAVSYNGGVTWAQE
jgi:hypothetical protein